MFAALTVRSDRGGVENADGSRAKKTLDLLCLGHTTITTTILDPSTCLSGVSTVDGASTLNAKGRDYRFAGFVIISGDNLVVLVEDPNGKSLQYLVQIHHCRSMFAATLKYNTRECSCSMITLHDAQNEPDKSLRPPATLASTSSPEAGVFESYNI
uniref:Uncharacterized protein n=1 Tax=Romanomermis culicivorax TaxID=13658 RepID=A0A915KNQ8_ROMCU